MNLENYKVKQREPIRIEKRMIDGQLIDVKIYAKSVHVEMPTNPIYISELRVVGVDSVDSQRDKSFNRE